ncbi:cupin domain-containing protein [Maliponia aquimaris]|uniref:Cupin domain protein n=1 Tax=Maliponia aquimaris TaxID=1673631 RepID=A0A238K1L3_9RHOB|nr:cupin domain-containing protein [Maliponia aquimaris]SMX36789.1 Cupin domain protein [Maliponia aquimaris]
MISIRPGVCALALAFVLGLAPAGDVLAQQTTAAPAETIKRTPLQKFAVPDSNYGTVIGLAEIVPDVLIGRHSHPGPESGYVIEGSFTLLIDGEAPRDLVAGDSYLVPAGVIHDARSGAQGAKVIATYVIENGQPLATPAN